MRFLSRVARGEVRGVISTVVLAELIHRRMMIAEAVERGLVDVRNAVRRLKEIHYHRVLMRTSSARV